MISVSDFLIQKSMSAISEIVSKKDPNPLHLYRTFPDDAFIKTRVPESTIVFLPEHDSFWDGFYALVIPSYSASLLVSVVSSVGSSFTDCVFYSDSIPDDIHSVITISRSSMAVHVIGCPCNSPNALWHRHSRYLEACHKSSEYVYDVGFVYGS